MTIVSYHSDILYRYTSNNQLRCWHSRTDGPKIWTVSSMYNGKEVHSRPKIAKPKNVNNANATTAEQQAVKEAAALFQKKVRDGWRTSPVEAAKMKAMPRVMLAHTATGVDDPRINFDRGVWIQPKLDGVRCVINQHGVWSRNQRSIHSCYHIFKALAPVFDKNPNLVLDGELYNHDLRNDFSRLQGLISRQNITPEIQAELERSLQYHVYDTIEDGKVFSSRYCDARLVRGLKTNIVQLVPREFATTPEEVEQATLAFCQEEYEGAMIRFGDSLYDQGKRSANLLKLKSFIDEEYTIVDVLEGEGQWEGAAKSIVVDTGLPNPQVCGVAGGYIYLREALLNKHMWIGGTATTKYFGKFPTGKLRFPVVMKMTPNDQ